MTHTPIKQVTPMDNGMLKVSFSTENSMILDMKPVFGQARFHPLCDSNIWNSAATDGRFVRWYKHSVEIVEISWDELVKMTIGTQFY